MPSPARRPCAVPGCPSLADRGGRCGLHARALERQRGSRTARGYTEQWYRFRAEVFRALLRHGIVPSCGATLPGGPQTTDSRCLAEGRIVASRLHLDHAPPLTPEERQDPRAVCDRRRVQVLCAACHAAKTRRERARMGYTP